ncbi:MAG: NINE protein [Bryobacterales bacterium]|nr:NINE protein [Bryobacterales bacterium]
MSLPVCPYCRAPIDETHEQVTVCPVCATPHHRDCWEENGGCTVFGCDAAPVEEAMVQVSADDLRFGPSATPVTQHPAPGWQQGSGLTDSDTTGVPPPPPAPGSGVPLPISTFAPLVIDPASVHFTHPELQPQPALDRKSYVWLAVCCGFVGAHNLYANRTSAGIIQLCMSLLSCFVLAPVVWIWALVEAATVDYDGDGFPMG